MANIVVGIRDVQVKRVPLFYLETFIHNRTIFDVVITQDDNYVVVVYREEMV